MTEKIQNDDWREELRGTYGNTGRMSRAGYNNLGGLGAGADGAQPSAEEMDVGAAEENEADEKPATHIGRWSESFGPRGFSGGFSGHEYNWTRRGEKKTGNDGS